jgi:hypothetical protein
MTWGARRRDPLSCLNTDNPVSAPFWRNRAVRIIFSDSRFSRFWHKWDREVRAGRMRNRNNNLERSLSVYFCRNVSLEDFGRWKALDQLHQRDVCAPENCVDDFLKLMDLMYFIWLLSVVNMLGLIGRNRLISRLSNRGIIKKQAASSILAGSTREGPPADHDG